MTERGPDAEVFDFTGEGVRYIPGEPQHSDVHVPCKIVMNEKEIRVTAGDRPSISSEQVSREDKERLGNVLAALHCIAEDLAIDRPDCATCAYNHEFCDVKQLCHDVIRVLEGGAASEGRK